MGLGRDVGISCALISYLNPTCGTDAVRFTSLFLSLPCNSMQTFIWLCRAKKVADTDENGETLKTNITKVYGMNESNQYKLIDHGIFLNYTHTFPDGIEDAYEGEPISAEWRAEH